MRIISGTHKGRRLEAPKKLPVRPTTDRSKEGLFNILQHKYDLKNTSVLDLFSGTGSISYEFGSRGVNNITAVDQNKNCVDFIRMTSGSLKLKIQVTKMDTKKYLSSVKTQFDIIFADPPYNLGFLQYIEVNDTVFDKHNLKRRGILII
ncbi:MAG: RsmD family RNA methyltransferase [Bacteroidota bacterium]|nr:RsmD family RNA methyltransferase [Bacteroidota bacterium]